MTTPQTSKEEGFLTSLPGSTGMQKPCLFLTGMAVSRSNCTSSVGISIWDRGWEALTKVLGAQPQDHHHTWCPTHSLEGSSWSCPQPRSAPHSSLSPRCPLWSRRIPRSEWDQSVAGSFPTHLPEVHCPMPSALYASCLPVSAGTTQEGSEGGTLGGMARNSF